MKLKATYSLATPESRKSLAGILSTVIGLRPPGPEFEPYRPNDDDLFWTLDRGNDWAVKFFLDEPFVFEISYRHQTAHERQEEALGGWLMYLLDAQAR